MSLLSAWSISLDSIFKGGIFGIFSLCSLFNTVSSAAPQIPLGSNSGLLQHWHWQPNALTIRFYLPQFYTFPFPLSILLPFRPVFCIFSLCKFFLSAFPLFISVSFFPLCTSLKDNRFYGSFPFPFLSLSFPFPFPYFSLTFPFPFTFLSLSFPFPLPFFSISFHSTFSLTNRCPFPLSLPFLPFTPVISHLLCAYLSFSAIPPLPHVFMYLPLFLK